MGDSVRVGEAEVALLSGDWDVGSVERVDEFEKTVRSFWRERAGERRREGMVVFWWCRVEMRFLVYKMVIRAMRAVLRSAQLLLLCVVVEGYLSCVSGVGDGDMAASCMWWQRLFGSSSPSSSERVLYVFQKSSSLIHVYT